jgi:alpha-beta hydrolase superfamily lysophospholipase
VALLLLHEAHQNRNSWSGFAQAAHEMGYAVLALDARGHGQSEGERVFDEAMDHDVEAVLAWLRASRDVDGDRIGIAGASLGANLALRAAARHPEIRSVALLSPGMILWQVDIREAVVDYGDRPLLLVAAEGDGYAARSAGELDELALGDHELRLLPGLAHGTGMLASDSDLQRLLLDWFRETVR